MFSNIRNERRFRGNGLRKRRLEFLKIRLYDIKNVVLQRRITYIGRKMNAANFLLSTYKPPHILSYCAKTVKIISTACDHGGDYLCCRIRALPTARSEPSDGEFNTVPCT